MTKRILVIDDEKPIQDIFKEALAKTDYPSDAAYTGADAIEMAKKQKYGLIFLDMKMPGMSGIDTFRELRKIDPDVTVYIITGFYDVYIKDLKTLAEKEGFSFEILRKPFSLSQILTVVKNVGDPA